MVLSARQLHTFSWNSYLVVSFVCHVAMVTISNAFSWKPNFIWCRQGCGLGNNLINEMKGKPVINDKRNCVGVEPITKCMTGTSCKMSLEFRYLETFYCSLKLDSVLFLPIIDYHGLWCHQMRSESTPFPSHSTVLFVASFNCEKLLIGRSWLTQ